MHMLCYTQIMLHESEMPNLFLVVLDLGPTYRKYVGELLQCHKDLLIALHKFGEHPLLSQFFVFSDDLMQRLLSQSMHFLHGYFSLYEPTAALMECPVRYGLLLSSVLGFAIKVLTQDYVLEHLPIREQLVLFGITVPFNETEAAAHRTKADAATGLNFLSAKLQQPNVSS